MPTAGDADKNSKNQSKYRSGAVQGTLTVDMVESLFPTPGTIGLSNGSGNCEKINALFGKGLLTDNERRSMRAGNGGSLNPDWVEALMGYPRQWTDIDQETITESAFPGAWEDGILRVVSEVKNRKNRLKCLGNAVVPQISKRSGRL
jgi:hypothetical protein